MYYSMEYFYSFDLQYFHSVCYFKTISFWKIRSNLLSDSISKIKQTLFYFIIFQTIFFLSKAKKIINHLNHQQLQQCLVITFHQWDDNNDQHQVLLSNCFPSVFWAFWHGFKVDNQPLVLKSALQEMRGKKMHNIGIFSVQCKVSHLVHDWNVLVTIQPWHHQWLQQCMVATARTWLWLSTCKRCQQIRHKPIMRATSGKGTNKREWLVRPLCLSVGEMRWHDGDSWQVSVELKSKSNLRKSSTRAHSVLKHMHRVVLISKFACCTKLW